MASLITTMFVPFDSSPPAPLPPLPTQCTLAKSNSLLTINSYTSLEDTPLPCPTHRSLATCALRDAIGSSPASLPRFLDRLAHLTLRNARTKGQFRPRAANKGTTSYQLRQFAEATLGSGSLRKAVKLPEGEDLNEWLAVNSE